jgi:hypothetical protein
MRRYSFSPALVSFATIATTHSLLGQSAEVPSPTACTAMDRAFVDAYHLYAVLFMVAIFCFAILVLPRLKVNRWWFTRPVTRLAIGSGPLLLVLLVFLALPLVETVYSISIGSFSILSLYQVTDSYLDCESVSYARQAFLLGDLFNAASKPAIFLGLYQLITFFLLVLFGAGLTYLFQWIRVKRYTLRGEH